MEKENEDIKSRVVFDWKNIFVVLAIVLAFSGGIFWDMVRNPSSGQETKYTEDVNWEGGVSQLQIEDIQVGDGEEAVAGKTVVVHYVGTFEDGSKFDSSYDRGAPFEFDLGAGRVIKGWDEGVVGMKVGGKRKLVIPPELGYGAEDYQSIPGNSTLYFEVELLEVK